MNTTNLFPCKSINLMKFLTSKGIHSEHSYKDANDNKYCWIYIKNNNLKAALDEWKNTKPN
jgi:hypothetical protein